MTTLVVIVIGGLLMSAIAMVGGLTAILRPDRMQRLLLPMVALAAGTLLGGAFFHMIPEGFATLDALRAAIWIVAGFVCFLILEQFLHWHHSHRGRAETRPVTYLILIGDALHNFIGGIGVASTYLVDANAGIMAWIAAAAHEIPQELGDFGVLVHSGWSRRRALTWNVISALTFPVGAVLAWFIAQGFDVAGLVLFGAGNFIYIAAADLIPEIRTHPRFPDAIANLFFFAVGIALMLLLALMPHAH